MFPFVPLEVIPSAAVIPKLAPDDNVKLPPPETTVPLAAICNVEPLFTVYATVLDTVPPDVNVCVPVLLKTIPLPVVDPVSVKVPAECVKLPATLTVTAFAEVPDELKSKVPPESEKSPETVTVLGLPLEHLKIPPVCEKLPPIAKLPVFDPPRISDPEPVLVIVKLPFTVFKVPTKFKVAVCVVEFQVKFEKL
jgi:hypothetical protein